MINSLVSYFNADGTPTTEGLKYFKSLATGGGSWDDITGKPATFTPSAHTHPLSDLTASGATSGQVATWNGSAWSPATPASGVSVEAFGAVGDGTTDCTAAVQAAIDYVADRISSSGAATARVYVNFGPGIFVCEQLTIKAFVTLRGSGVSATEIRLKNDTDDHLIISPNFATLTGTDVCLPGEGVINNIGFERLRLFGNKANNTAGDGIRVIAKNIRMDDVVIQDFPGNGLYTELGLQCPLNDWDIIVEGDIRGLKCFNNNGHGWHQRGPHDQYVTDFKAWLNGGDGWRIENNGGSYTAPCDFVHAHCYANAGKGLNIIGNNSVKGTFLRVENNDEEGLYIPSANNCHFEFISALDNCQVSTSRQIYIGANYCTIANLRVRRSGRAGAVDGVEVAGGGCSIHVSALGDVTGGGFSSGAGVRVTGSFNKVNLNVQEYQSGTGLISAGNYNEYRGVIQNCGTCWSHTAGTGSTFRLTGTCVNGGTLKAGNDLATGSGLERGDIFFRESGAATTYRTGATGNILHGSGTPEAVVSSPVGTLFLRTDGGTGTTAYIKESGSGNTGWVAVASGGSAAWGGITGTLSAQTDLQAALDAKQNVGPASVMSVAWHAQAGGTLTLTNSPLAARIALNQPTRMVKLVPLDGHTQVRMAGVQVTTSASVNTPLLRLRYKTGAYSTAVGDYLQLGTSAECEFTLTGTGVRDTGWIDLAAGATGDIQVALIELGGDGGADPALGHVHVFFR